MTKKSRKVDRKLLSGQAHEIAYMAKKLGVSRLLIKQAHKVAGRSRVQVIAFVKGYMHAA